MLFIQQVFINYLKYVRTQLHAGEDVEMSKTKFVHCMAMQYSA